MDLTWTYPKDGRFPSCILPELLPEGECCHPSYNWHSIFVHLRPHLLVHLDGMGQENRESS